MKKEQHTTGSGVFSQQPPVRLADKVDKLAQKITDEILEKIRNAAENPEDVLIILNDKQLLDYATADWESFIKIHIYMLFAQKDIPPDYAAIINENFWDIV